MDLRLDGKVALVTGGSRGIGRAIAHALAEAGAKVMISSRTEEKLRDAVDSIGREAAYFVADAGDPDAPEQCVRAAVEQFGTIDIFINNAANYSAHGPLVGLLARRADRTTQVNIRGLVLWTQAVWNASMSEGGGSIINIASSGAFRSVRGIGYYNATKAAQVSLTASLALELGPKVRVNSIAPGWVRTDTTEAAIARAGDAYAAKLPLRRLGEPEDIAGAAVFLASDASSWITGHTLVVDGGSLAVSLEIEGFPLA